MRRIHEAGRGARPDRALGFQCGHLRAFQRDPGNDGKSSVSRFDEALDHGRLFVRGQKSPLPGMTENDQAFDAGEAAEP